MYKSSAILGSLFSCNVSSKLRTRVRYTRDDTFRPKTRRNGILRFEYLPVHRVHGSLLSASNSVDLGARTMDSMFSTTSAYRSFFHLGTHHISLSLAFRVLQQRRAVLAVRRQGEVIGEPRAVVTTWSLLFVSLPARPAPGIALWSTGIITGRHRINHRE